MQNARILVRQIEGIEICVYVTAVGVAVAKADRLHESSLVHDILSQALVEGRTGIAVRRGMFINIQLTELKKAG